MDSMETIPDGYVVKINGIYIRALIERIYAVLYLWFLFWCLLWGGGKVMRWRGGFFFPLKYRPAISCRIYGGSTVPGKGGEMKQPLAWDSGKPHVQSQRSLSISCHTLLAMGTSLFHAKRYFISPPFLRTDSVSCVHTDTVIFLFLLYVALAGAAVSALFSLASEKNKRFTECIFDAETFKKKKFRPWSVVFWTAYYYYYPR